MGWSPNAKHAGASELVPQIGWRAHAEEIVDVVLFIVEKPRVSLEL